MLGRRCTALAAPKGPRAARARVALPAARIWPCRSSSLPAASLRPRRLSQPFPAAPPSGPSCFAARAAQCSTGVREGSTRAFAPCNDTIILSFKSKQGQRGFRRLGKAFNRSSSAVGPEPCRRAAGTMLGGRVYGWAGWTAAPGAKRAVRQTEGLAAAPRQGRSRGASAVCRQAVSAPLRGGHGSSRGAAGWLPVRSGTL